MPFFERAAKSSHINYYIIAKLLLFFAQTNKVTLIFHLVAPSFQDKPTISSIFSKISLYIWRLEVEETSYELHEVETEQVIVTLWHCQVTVHHVHVVQGLVHGDIWSRIGNNLVSETGWALGVHELVFLCGTRCWLRNYIGNDTESVVEVRHSRVNVVNENLKSAGLNSVLDFNLHELEPVGNERWVERLREVVELNTSDVALYPAGGFDVVGVGLQSIDGTEPQVTENVLLFIILV